VQNKEGHIATSILAVIQSIALIVLVFLYTVSLPKAPYYKAWLTAVKTTAQPQPSQLSGTIWQHWLHRLRERDIGALNLYSPSPNLSQIIWFMNKVGIGPGRGSSFQTHVHYQQLLSSGCIFISKFAIIIYLNMPAHCLFAALR